MRVQPTVERKPLAAVAPNIPTAHAAAEFTPELVECGAATTEKPAQRLERVVRLPCSKCDVMLPPFTASWDMATCGVAVRVVTCVGCERALA